MTIVALLLGTASATVFAQSALTPAAGTDTSASAGPSSTSAGPVRLRSAGSTATLGTQIGTGAVGTLRAPQQRPEYRLGEFERYVQTLADPSTTPPPGALAQPLKSSQLIIRRFGADLMLPAYDDAETPDPAPLVPPDYLVKPGDEIVVTLWGSVDADVRAVVDRAGRITLPRVGPVLVAGVRYADLGDTISRRVAQVFKNFQLSASLGQLRGVRVYVTGYAVQPGAYGVTSLSTLIGALARAGGPSAAGSFRDIQLKRGGQVLSTFDLYDFLVKGDKSADRLLEAGDVIHVGPVGAQIALLGSVNQPAIFELKPGETIDDALRMAGGFSAVADRSRLTVERLDDRSDRRVRQLGLPADRATPLTNGDVLRAFSAVDATLPLQRQNKRVRIEGEVLKPGEYVLPPDSTINDALRVAGGLTNAAYLFGTEFSRESVRVTQQENYERALRDMETEFTRASSTQRASTADEAASLSARASANTRLIERLRAVRPTGRVVLELAADASALPDLALEHGDRLYVPPKPTTVGVFGSVFNAGSYLFGGNRRVDDYLRLAGGPTRGADTGSVFVVRANGSVVSGRQNSGWFNTGSGLSDVPALPGDTLFVPEELNKTTWIQNAKDWTQIFYQFGIGAAALKTIRGN